VAAESELIERIQVEVFRIVTPCSDVVVYQRFGWPCCLLLHPGGL